MGVKKDNNKLTAKMMLFCENLANGKSQRESYNLAYPSDKRSDVVTDAAASRLLSSVKVFNCYQSLLKKTAEKSQITREKVLNEFAKIGFSSIAHLHNTWIERKDFEQLTEDQKACIMEISTQTRSITDDNGDFINIDFVKIKLYDKLKALESIGKMLGFNEPDKLDVKLIGVQIVAKDTKQADLIAGLKVAD